ncbi:hypothetical protein BC941DRAFT_445667 [Chlamydoabsidia padenii]|nr:hypothetical protein BC941DRAFT_445667 [Chlamydoabsidia padenii]
MIIPILIKPQIVPPNLLHLFPESLPLVVMKMMMLLLRLMMSLKVMKVIPISILVSVLLLKVLLLLEMLLLMMFLLAVLLLLSRIRRHRQRIVEEERRIQEEDNLHLVEMSYNRMLPEDQATIFHTTTNRDRYLADTCTPPTYNLGSVQSQHPPH